MEVRGSYSYEAEIRDTESHVSTEESPGVTVLTDEIGDADFTPYERFRVYVLDTHDRAYEVSVEGRGIEDSDTDWTGAAQHGDTISADGNGEFVDSTSFDGPVGDLRMAMTAASTAATTGSLRVTIEAMG